MAKKPINKGIESIYKAFVSIPKTVVLRIVAKQFVALQNVDKKRKARKGKAPAIEGTEQGRMDDRRRAEGVGVGTVPKMALS